MNTQDKARQTQRLTLPLYNLGCSSGDALTIERILAQQPGVIEVYANPATEVAYVAYDPTLTTEDQLAATITHTGFGPRANKSEGITMTTQPSSSAGRFFRSRSGLVLLVFLAIAAFFLITEHTAHLFGALPYVLLLSCLVLHLFMHRGHGSHASHGDSHNHVEGGKE